MEIIMNGFEFIADKYVLVTGGSGAIGQAIARGFLDAGAKVILWGHRDIDDTIKNEVTNYRIVELENQKDIEDAFLRELAEDHLIQILINCAGYTFGSPSEAYLYEKWNKTLNINLTAPFLLSQLFARNLITQEKEGSIVNITSIGAEFGFPQNPAYVASKGGLKQLTKGLAYDWAKYGIRVNNVGPGYTQTKMTQESWNNEETRKMRSDHTLLKRWAKPDDIVGTVLFLSSDLAEYITGQDVYVDGGWTVKGL